MLKRTTVKFLLAVLVITGLAGTADDASLTAAEKKVVVKSLKDSRDQLLSEYKKFSEKQAQFSPQPDVAAAAVCIKNLQAWEENAWEKLKAAMRRPAPQNGEPACASNTPDSPALAGDATDFKSLRQSGIRYVRNSTENFKTHYVAAEDGCVTGYQYILAIIERTNQATAALRNIRQHPQFPAE
jgi:hypothetical protein